MAASPDSPFGYKKQSFPPKSFPPSRNTLAYQKTGESSPSISRDNLRGGINSSPITDKTKTPITTYHNEKMYPKTIDDHDNNYGSDNHSNGKEAETQPKQQLTALQLIRRFGESTSMHGLSHALGDGPAWRRVFWSLLVLGFACWATHNVIAIIRDFRSHPVLTSVSSEYQSKVRFPGVTICNLNRVRRSKANPTLLQNIDLNFLFGANPEHVNTLIDSEVRSASFEQQEEMGHQLEDMLYSCYFGSETCTDQNFSNTFSLNYGNCFTFASSLDSSGNNWETVKAGPQNGLMLELNVEHTEYLSSSAVGGVKVVIQDNGEYPFPGDGGLTVGPGFYTSIGIRKTDIKRLSSPYGSCLKSTTNDTKNLFSAQGYSYSLNACQKSCFQQHVYQQCSCCDSSIPCVDSALVSATGKALPSGGLFYCNTTQDEVQVCVDDVTQAFTENKLGCTNACPPACEESVFSTSVSQGFWPTASYSSVLRRTLENTGRYPNVTDYNSFFSQSFLRLEVYYDSLILEKVESEPAYTWNKLLGDVGGQLGLLLGFSILTAIEIIELFVLDLGWGLGLLSMVKGRKQAVADRAL